jgi:hypothetical protein
MEKGQRRSQRDEGAVDSEAAGRSDEAPSVDIDVESGQPEYDHLDSDVRARAIEPLAKATGVPQEALLGEMERALDHFEPLAQDRPELDAELKRRYAEVWTAHIRVPGWSEDDAVASVDLEVAPGSKSGELRLRCRSRYTGSTYTLDPWDGSVEQARSFISEMAHDQADNVQEERADWKSALHEDQSRDG